MKMKTKVCKTYAAAAAQSLQSCPTLCDLRDGSPPGSSVHGMFQGRVPEWGAIAFSKKLVMGTHIHLPIFTKTLIFFTCVSQN